MAFWAKRAEEIVWFEKWKETYIDEPYAYKWFVGGKLNISYNSLDRHVEAGKGEKVALIWEPEPPNEPNRILTYKDLLAEVSRLANALKRLGIKKGDRVGIYLPMIPEAVIAMQACVRIGAVHTVVFSAFSAESLRRCRWTRSHRGNFGLSNRRRVLLGRHSSRRFLGKQGSRTQRGAPPPRLRRSNGGDLGREG